MSEFLMIACIVYYNLGYYKLVDDYHYYVEKHLDAVE